MALDPEPRVAEVADSARYQNTTPAISVLISTFRRPDYLAGLLDCLAAQDLPPERFEVVIVDNASNDDTWATLQQRAASASIALRAARIEVNGGPSTGRNMALHLARADLVAFTDDDTLPEPGWVATMLHALEDGRHLVQGRTEPAPTVGPRNRWDHTVAVRANTPFFETCNIGYRRSELVDAGGFQPLVGYRPGRGGTPFGGEDTVLGWKVLRAAHAEPTFVTDAVVLHRVEPRDYAGYLRMRTGTSIFPLLVKNVPEIRRSFFLRYFFNRRSAAFDLAVVGLALTAVFRSPLPLVALVPYIAMLAPRHAGLRNWAGRLTRIIWGDVAAAWSLWQGSIRYRSVVL